MSSEATEAISTNSLLCLNFRFQNAEAFDQDLSVFHTESVTGMSFMFKDAFKDRGLESWESHQYKHLHESTFHFADSFNADVRRWDVSHASKFVDMFNGAHSFDRRLDWHIKADADVKHMFLNARSFSRTLCWDLNRTQQTDLSMKVLTRHN